MKQRFTATLVLVSLLAAFALPVSVAAQTETEESDHNNSGNSATAKERLEKKKTELNIRLEDAQKTKIKSRCKVAQGTVKERYENLGSRAPGRTKAYENLVSRLENLVAKLQKAQIDTTTLETQLTELETKIETYTTDLATYQQALSDLKDVDCVADPDAFQAALLTARTALTPLVDDVAAIRTYVQDTIKPTLQTLKAQLEQASATAETNESGDNE